MKNFTIEEKQDLHIALDHFIDSLETTRSILHDIGNENGNALAPTLTKFRDLRVKLILDIAPIEIKATDEICEQSCILCGVADTPCVIEWAYVDNKFICQLCFKKYEPKAYEKARKLDKEYWMKEYPEDFNADGTFKSVVTEDSLPF